MKKKCFKCGLEKPRTEFYRHPRMGDGLLGKCRQCTRLDVRANRASRAEYYRAYDRARYAINPARKAAATQAFIRSHKAHPERKRASTKVAYAIRSGKLVPQPCWVCGEKAEAHHPDYSAPLDVVWLCVLHHRQTHNMLLQIDDEPIAA